MFSAIWHSFFFDPVYNALIFFVDIIPGGDVGLAIIATTIVVKFLLLPLSLKAVRTQRKMRELEPQLTALKEKYKEKTKSEEKAEQAKEMMAIYRDAGMNPFASIILVAIQIPIIIALYLSVSGFGGVALPEVNVELLYSFVPEPETITMLFLGALDITAKSLPLALLAGITQFFHGQLAIPKAAPRDPDSTPSFKDDFARTMQLQMKYFMPIIITVVAYSISAAIALYFVVSNLMQIAQELVVRKER